MERSSLIFCGGSIALSLLVAAIAYPYLTLSNAQVNMAKSVVDAEQLEAMDLGDFGIVAVSELVDYYIENPPEPVAAGTVKKRVRFEGC